MSVGPRAALGGGGGRPSRNSGRDGTVKQSPACMWPCPPALRLTLEQLFRDLPALSIPEQVSALCFSGPFGLGCRKKNKKSSHLLTHPFPFTSSSRSPGFMPSARWKAMKSGLGEEVKPACRQMDVGGLASATCCPVPLSCCSAGGRLWEEERTERVKGSF